MPTDLIQRIDELAEKMGGRFKLAALIQRRLQEITHTAPHLLHHSGDTPIRMVLKEIEDGKIELEPDEETIDASILGE
ncbi:MAG: DNA-directed RNA polymerase subunit omega [Planctomycetota bacterium]|jgi:DNA-directed RNA polymerase subunit K/omega